MVIGAVLRYLRPRSLAGRTVLVLVLGLALVQAAGLAIHALDRIELQRIGQYRDAGVRLMSIYRSVALTPQAQRETVVREVSTGDGAVVSLQSGPPMNDMLPTPQPLRRQIVVNMQFVGIAAAQRYREIVMLGGPGDGRLVVGMRLWDGPWVHITLPLATVQIWHSRSFLLAFLGMTLAAAGLTVWAVRRLTAPVRVLAQAAERLGRDVNTPPLPEDGPEEIASAAASFNTMALRIRRFVQDRTFMLTAIGHDLRTPITRLKLRAEFVDDEELRRKMVADLDELEAMVAATLAFGRDVTTDEPETTVDLTELVRTVLDEAADSRPDLIDRMTYAGPDHLPIRARPLGLKRALTNLVMNALKYGDAAEVSLSRTEAGGVVLLIEDRGPGIPASEIERLFQPFQRMEQSRNKETGGMGLGLPIARNILRAHGGDVTLGHRSSGGVRASVVLPG
jgi:signal transduction histidine kinase